MKFISTRNQSPKITFSEALRAGLAPDGGLYVPERFPDFSTQLERFEALDLAALGAEILRPFLSDDPLGTDTVELCRRAFNFPVPLKFIRHLADGSRDEVAVLELFHGPTAAFKDVGARFLAECIARDPQKQSDGAALRTVIVATSGDTGGAVAGAFYDKPGIEVIVLYPKGKISLRQEKQITCWGKNVRAIAVRGTFDDCQRVVKEVLSDQNWRKNRSFISANSISIGRLLPQMIYYAHSSLQFLKRRNVAPAVVVPTGNLGNGVAALWAKRVGFPLGQVVLATNANRAIADFFVTGEWSPQATIATLANAMDVGYASNAERLRDLYPVMDELRRDVQTLSVSDAEIRETIEQGLREWGEVWCPHTATAVVARKKLGLGESLVVATAHPAKFETIVEPLIGRTIEVPPTLGALLDREIHFVEIEPSAQALKAAMSTPEVSRAGF